MMGLHANLHDIPPSRKDEVEKIFEYLKEHDPKAYATLTSVPVEHWCGSTGHPHRGTGLGDASA